MTDCNCGWWFKRRHPKNCPHSSLPNALHCLLAFGKLSLLPASFPLNINCPSSPRHTHRPARILYPRKASSGNNKNNHQQQARTRRCCSAPVLTCFISCSGCDSDECIASRTCTPGPEKTARNSSVVDEPWKNGRLAGRLNSLSKVSLLRRGA